MKKLFYYFLHFVFLSLLITCGGSEENKINADYIEITLNGKTIKKEIFWQGTGFSGQTGCINKPHFLQLLGQFEDSSFFFDGNLLHLENDIDFKNTLPRAYGVKNKNLFSSSACNLDLEASLEDKTLSNKTTQLMSGGINTVTSIKKGNSSSTENEYTIVGNFNVNFKNASNIVIPVSGKYQITISVLK